MTEFTLHPFNLGLRVITSPDEYNARKFNGTPFPDGQAFTCFETHGDLITVVIDVKSRKGYELHNTCVHEAVHVWQGVKTIVHEDNPGAETEAYFIAMVARCLFTACKTKNPNQGS